MNEQEKVSLYTVKGTLEAQRDSYLKRLHYNARESRSPSTPFSLSFLEGERRTLESALEAVKRVLGQLDQLTEDIENVWQKS